MTKQSIFCGVCLASLLSQDALATGAGSSHGRAEVIEEDKWEIGLYAPLRRGLSQDLEVAIHPITTITAPHVAVKKLWKRTANWDRATRHSIVYPTPMLRMLARRGTGGILPGDAVVPTIISIDSRVLQTHRLDPATTLTLSMRVQLGVEIGESDWPSLDMPIGYPRTLAYQDNLATAAAVQLDGSLVAKFSYRLRTEFWSSPLVPEMWAVEGKGTLIWRASASFTAQLTGMLIVGEYPYGSDWHALPGFDLIWAF